MEDKPKETQEQREKRCHKEADQYYYLIAPKTPEELKWFHHGVEFGAKWVDTKDGRYLV